MPARPVRSPERRLAPERTLTVAVFALVLFGLVMVYSASSAGAVVNGSSPTFLLQRQMAYALVGLVAFVVATRLPMTFLRRLGPPLLALALLGLLLVLVPGIGHEANGSQRWILIGSLGQLQPSEFAKLALVLWIAQAAARAPRRVTRAEGLVPFMVVTGVLCLLILAEPDLGTAMLIFAIALTMLLVAGAQVKHVALIVAGAAVVALLAVVIAPYRRARLTAFIDPWADPDGAGFQSVQAQLSVASGGVTGVGLGDGVQKVFYLPEAHTDMILAIVGEELGLIGIVGVLAALVVIAVSGFAIALRAADRFSQLAAAGITTAVVIQAIINAGAVLGVMPITGVPLPFVSFGGSSLLVLLISAGILVNIGNRSGGAPRLRVISGGAGRDRGRGDRRARDAGDRGGRRLGRARG